MKRLCIALLAAGLLLVCQPASAQKDHQDRCGHQPHLSRGQRQAMVKAQKLMAKDNAQAGRVLAQYAKTHPGDTHFKFSFLRGVIAYQARKPAQAKQHFAKAVELWPCYVPALRNLAAVSYELGQPAQAARLMLKAHEQSQKPQPQDLYQAAAFFLAAKQPAKALPLLSGLAARPDAKSPWLKALVRTYLELNRFQQARVTLDRLLRRFPGDADLWKLSARLCLEKSDYAKAAADLEISYRLSSPPAAKWKTLADLYRMAGVPRKAARYYRRSFGGKPKDKELYLLAGVFFEAKCLDQARQAIDEALKLKASLKGWRLLAQIHMQNKNYKEAINAYMAASRLAPKNARLELMAGYCAMQMEDYQQALDHLTQAVARAKPNSKDAKEAKRTMNSIKKYLDAEKGRKPLGLEQS